MTINKNAGLRDPLVNKSPAIEGNAGNHHVAHSNQTCACAAQLRGSRRHMMIEKPYVSGVWFALKLSAVPIRTWQSEAGSRGCLCVCVL